MKKINLKGISEVLSEKELKSISGGSFGGSHTDCAVVCQGRSSNTACSCNEGGGRSISAGRCIPDKTSGFLYCSN